MAAAWGCRDKKPVNQYQLQGVIVRLVPEYRLVIIKHEPIRDDAGKVWMEAMTMEFPVRDPKLFGMLRKGAKIRARVYEIPSEYEYWIGEVQEVTD